MTTALIIVHLSSLGEYITTSGGVRGAKRLMENIRRAALRNDGPVYFVIDPQWSGGAPSDERIAARFLSKLMSASKMVSALKNINRPVRIFEYDTDSWELLFPDMRRQMKKDGVDRAVVGGLWCAITRGKVEPGWYGCVNVVYRWLKNEMRIPVTVNLDLVGN